MTLEKGKLPRHVAIILDHAKLFNLLGLRPTHSENLGGRVCCDWRFGC